MGKVNLEKMKAFQEKLQGGQSGFWVPKVGTNQIRVLPPLGNNDMFFLETIIHFLPGDMPVRCLRAEGEECAVCILVDKLRKQEDDPKKVELSRRLEAKKRYLYYVVDLDDEESGIQVYSSGIKVMQQVSSYFADPEWGDLTDPKTGHDIILERLGSGLNTSYIVKPKKSSSPIAEKYLSEDVKDLSTIIPVLSPQEVTNKLKQFIQRLKEDPSIASFESKKSTANEFTKAINNKKAAQVKEPIVEKPVEAPKPMEAKKEPESNVEEEVSTDILDELENLEEFSN